MARYTDIDKLIAEYDRVHVGPAGGARKLMVEAPIADVAPRAEIERLQAVHADMTESLRLASEANKDMQAELEDLREIVFMDRSEAIKNLKAEAIKEFAQRLKKKMYPYNGVDKKTYAINAYAVEKAIEDLVKEMMENDK